MAAVRPLLGFCLAVGLWIAAGLGLPGVAHAADDGDLFGARSVRSGNMAAFPRWTGMLERYFKGTDPMSRVCKGDVFRRCMSEEWKTFLEGIAGDDPMTKIRKVNAEMNRARYTLDMTNYGEADYWATPYQFFKMDGDCEDYSIAKFLSLRALGFDNDSLRVVILDDLNLRVAHAILVVTLDGTQYVLDNQIAQVVPASSIHHYKPIYSLNEASWWLYRPKPAAPAG
ncbi:MAG TPA: transglutaminase-like cysteine peptidase [Alphaproteobacteria bacterium]|jgi:predicted transglutaminase-like cysteine proteinase